MIALSLIISKSYLNDTQSTCCSCLCARILKNINTCAHAWCIPIETVKLVKVSLGVTTTVSDNIALLAESVTPSGQDTQMRGVDPCGITYEPSLSNSSVLSDLVTAESEGRERERDPKKKKDYSRKDYLWSVVHSAPGMCSLMSYYPYYECKFRVD